MIDTHAHLTDADFRDDLPAVLRNAEMAGVRLIICVSETAQDAEIALRLSATHAPLIQPAIGLHPERVVCLEEHEISAQLGSLNELMVMHGTAIVAVGEVGLDFTPRVLSRAPSLAAGKERQKIAFNTLIDIAKRHDLPLSVHSRGAGHHALDMLITAAVASGDEMPPRACMHAFDGRPIHAERALNALPNSLYFSVPPSIVRSDCFARLVRRVPLERLLLESDAPALPASQGTRNEPSEITRALHMIAALKGCSIEHTNTVLTRNTHTLFTRLPS